MNDEPITIQSPQTKKDRSNKTTLITIGITLILTIIFSIFLFTRPDDDSMPGDTIENPTATPTMSPETTEQDQDEAEITSFDVEDNAIYQVTADGQTEILSTEQLNAVAPNEAFSIATISWDFSLEYLFIHANVGTDTNYIIYSDLNGENVRGIDYAVDTVISPSGTYLAYVNTDANGHGNLYIYNFSTQEYQQIVDNDSGYCSTGYTIHGWSNDSTLIANYEGYLCDDLSKPYEYGEQIITVEDYFN